MVSVNNNLTGLNAFDRQGSLHVAAQEVQNCPEQKYDTVAWEGKTPLLCMKPWNKKDKGQTEKGNRTAPFFLQKVDLYVGVILSC